MIHPSPIPALIDYYHRLSDDPNQDIAPFGFSRQKIGFRVVIEPDGSPFAIQNSRQQIGSQSIPISLTVPGQSKSSGQGINPGFLWDNAQYMLGTKHDDPKPERTARAFEAFKQRHISLTEQIDDSQFTAVCRFLDRWNPAMLGSVQGHELLEEPGSGFGVFQVRGEPDYVHNRSAVLDYWRQSVQSGEEAETSTTAQSLVSGRCSRIARLHEPKIKGVVGGQSSGAVLVGFNEDAYASYGKAQSYNAPVAEDEAFEYCTALNRLLADDAHRTRLGDATIVFWSDRATESEHLIAAIFGQDPTQGRVAEDAGTTERIKHFYDALKQGVSHGGIADAAIPFYILGLSPNAARVSVRFWLADTVGHLTDRLAAHVRALEIIGAPDDRPLTVRHLLLETAREAKDIPPQLAGDVARAILSGSQYPLALYTAVLRRIRAEQSLKYPRAAILKACLIRNFTMEAPVALNKDHPDQAYQMGRLFAALEKTQEEALPGVKRTIKDGYFATASTTPGAVFPRVLRLHQHHIEKLEGGLKINRERLIQEICSRIDRFPAHLPMEQQGLFDLAYYHQRQDFFTKRDVEESTPTLKETANA